MNEFMGAAVTGGLTTVGAYYFVNNNLQSALIIGVIAATSGVLGSWLMNQFMK